MRRFPNAIARRIALFALTVGLVVAAGCKSATPIKDILDDPGRFSGKTVQIAGDVKSSVGVLGAGTYEVSDGTGSIHVVTKSGGVPREGAKVGVEGTVQSGYTIGSESLTVLIESKRYTP
jgi:hypothetical protein